MEDSEKAIVTFEYTNYEGKTAIRKVRPYQLLFTSNAYYKTPQSVSYTHLTLPTTPYV